MEHVFQDFCKQCQHIYFDHYLLVEDSPIPHEQTAPLVWLRGILPLSSFFPVMKNKIVVLGTCEPRLFDAYPLGGLFSGLVGVKILSVKKIKRVLVP